VKLTLSLISLALIGVLVLQWRDWPSNAPAPLPSAADADSPPAAEMPPADNLLPPLPPKEDYASVVERPLFLPDRRPPPDEPEEEEIPEPEQLTDLSGTDLTAVVITPDIVSAWVRSPRERESIRLRIGDEFEGWTVQTIEPDRLVLQRQGETDELRLRDYQNAPAVIPPTRLPTPRGRRQTERQPPTDATPDDRTNAAPRTGADNARRAPVRASVPPAARR
jgi:general secretion pathway protein N